MQATLVAVVLGAIFGAQLRLWSARQKERGTAKKLSRSPGVSHVGSPTPSLLMETTTVSSNSGEDIWVGPIQWDSSNRIQIYESRMPSGASKVGSPGPVVREQRVRFAHAKPYPDITVWPPKEGLPG